MPPSEKSVEPVEKSLDVETFDDDLVKDGNDLIPTESIYGWTPPTRLIDAAVHDLRGVDKDGR